MKSYLRQAVVQSALAAFAVVAQTGLAVGVDQQSLFTEDRVVLANGVAGNTVHVDSGNPKNYEEIVAKSEFPHLQLKAKLFLPDNKARHPVVIIMPGSSGAGNSAIAHATALTSVGIAVLVIDPFGARSVTSTVADQGQVSFAASSYDVLAAAKYLSTLPEIDGARIGALGYSRGGTAVLQAAVAPLASAVLGSGVRFRAVVAAWPWCGYQFERPDTRPPFVVDDVIGVAARVTRRALLCHEAGQPKARADLDQHVIIEPPPTKACSPTRQN